MLTPGKMTDRMPIHAPSLMTTGATLASSINEKCSHGFTWAMTDTSPAIEA
jgi:hypothetical protein